MAAPPGWLDARVARVQSLVDGVELAQFSQLVGIRSKVEPDPHTSEPATRLPGRRKAADGHAPAGQTRDLSLSAWHEPVGRDPEAGSSARS